MSLTPGARLGVYEIVAIVGSGGMGEVYRARDARLNRDVAIKVLPASFSGDAERLDRSEHEARLLEARAGGDIDPSPDGQRFLANIATESPSLVTLLLNWSGAFD
jgi:serine/threonine protein kinase